jgi:hypothetical protein
MDTPCSFRLGARNSIPMHLLIYRARADWIELLRNCGQLLLSVANWESILSSLPQPSAQRTSSMPSMKDIANAVKPENSAGAAGAIKSDYPITTERAGIVSRFVEDIVFGNKAIIWDLGPDDFKLKKKSKPKK